MNSPRMRAANRIGEARESSLHASLKIRYAGIDGDTETSVGGYVCDALRADGVLVEIQTGSFAPLKDKIPALAKERAVRIIHPVPRERIIEVREPDGTLIRSRKSPKKGSPWDLFAALVYAPLLPLVGRVSIEIAMTEETETRKNDGKGSWRRKGVSIADRKLRAVRESIVLADIGDYRMFVPAELLEPFSAKDLAGSASIKADLARKALYVLTRIGIVERSGAKGNTKLYRRTAGKAETVKSLKGSKRSRPSPRLPKT